MKYCVVVSGCNGIEADANDRWIGAICSFADHNKVFDTLEEASMAANKRNADYYGKQTQYFFVARKITREACKHISNAKTFRTPNYRFPKED